MRVQDFKDQNKSHKKNLKKDCRDKCLTKVSEEKYTGCVVNENHRQTAR